MINKRRWGATVRTLGDLRRRARTSSGGSWGAGGVGAVVGRYLGSRSSSRVLTNVQGSNAYTGIKTQYRKKRMPRRRRRRWVRFAKKTQSVINKSLGSNQFVSNSRQGGISWNAAGNSTTILNQKWNTFDLFARNGDGSNSFLASMLGQLFNLDASSDDRRLMIDSGCIDFTLRFDGHSTVDPETGSVSGVSTGPIALELDIYEIVYGATTKDNASFYNDIQDAMNVAFGSTLQEEQRGVTLFQAPVLSSVYRAKIIRKRRLILGVGQVENFQFRTARNKSISCQRVFDTPGHVYPYLTRTWAFCGRLIVPEALRTVGVTISAGLTVAATRTCNVRLLEISQRKSVFG